jgi:hypothetical protein
MDYGYILRRAWRITWHHKVLWLFGFLVGLSGRLRAGVSWRDLPPETRRAVQEFAATPYFIPTIVALVLLGIGVGLALVFLRALGRSALVDQVYQAENGNAPSARDGWRRGRSRAWRVFQIVLLLSLPISVVAAVGSLPLTLVSRRPSPEAIPDLQGVLEMMGTGLLCLAPAVCLGVLLSIPLGVLQWLAVLSCVLEGLTAWRSIVRGWEVLRDNLAAVAALWLILLVVAIGLAVALGLPLGALAAVLLASLLFYLRDDPAAALGAMLGLTFLGWLAGAAFTSVVETFRSAFWTLAYRQLTGMGRTGKESGFSE